MSTPADLPEQERLSGASEIPYGDPSLVSNYYKQTGPRLSKHFKTV